MKSSTPRRAISVLGLVAAAAGGLAAQPAVTQVSPIHDATGISALGHVTWTFDQPLNPATVHGGSVKVFGRWSGVMAGVRTLENGGTRIRFAPSGPFSAGELVSAMVTTAVTSAGGAPLPRTHATQFWIAAAPAATTLSQVLNVSVRLPGEGLITSYGINAADLDNDGYPDLCIPNEDSDDVRRFMNDGAGGFLPFTIHGLPANSRPSANESADFNGDGWTDLVVCNIQGNSVGVFLNDGTGSFLAPAVLPVGSGPRGIAVLDADSDGDTDIVTANRVGSNLSLLRNTGNGTFLAATSFQGGVTNETALVAADANGDGALDLFVGGYGSSNVALLLGDGAGSFTLSATVAAGGRPWMLSAGDVDRDGDVDVVAALSDVSRASVIRNNGAGGLLPAVTYVSGLFTIAIRLGDLDGDGDLDMVTSNFNGVSFGVYRNAGNGTFGAATTLPAVSAGSCTTIADVDGDEDVELIGVDEVADRFFVFRSPALPVQRASLGAALSVNGTTGSPGFGGLPPLPVSLGSVVTAGLLGHPGQAWALAIGLSAEPGLASPGGTLGLSLVPAPLFLANGFAAPGVFVLDASGMAALAQTVPPTLPAGVAITLQGAISNPANLALGLTLTNPFTVVTSP